MQTLLVRSLVEILLRIGIRTLNKQAHASRWPIMCQVLLGQVRLDGFCITHSSDNPVGTVFYSLLFLSCTIGAIQSVLLHGLCEVSAATSLSACEGNFSHEDKHQRDLSPFLVLSSGPDIFLRAFSQVYCLAALRLYPSSPTRPLYVSYDVSASPLRYGARMRSVPSWRSVGAASIWAPLSRCRRLFPRRGCFSR